MTAFLQNWSCCLLSQNLHWPGCRMQNIGVWSSAIVGKRIVTWVKSPHPRLAGSCKRANKAKSLINKNNGIFLSGGKGRQKKKGEIKKGFVVGSPLMQHLIPIGSNRTYVIMTISSNCHNQPLSNIDSHNLAPIEIDSCHHFYHHHIYFVHRSKLTAPTSRTILITLSTSS